MATREKSMFSERDIEIAHAIHAKEKIDTPNLGSMFCAGLYSILCISERWETADSVYNVLLRKGFADPESIREKPRELKVHLQPTRWHNKKFSFLRDFSVWWGESQLPMELLNDIATGRNGEFELRNRIAESAPGIAYKSASLFMLKLGYMNIVPIDIWECRFLSKSGYDVRIGDYVTTSGPSGRKYLDCEAKVIETARKQGLSPVIFHLALWGRSHAINGLT